MRLFLFVGVGLAALAWASAASAQPFVEDNPTLIDEITVTATRSEQAVDEVPATVSVITDEEMDDLLVVDIKDLVRFEPGVSVPNGPARFGAAFGSTGRDGNAGFNIRGLEGNRVLIQTDGIRAADAFSFGPTLIGRDYVELDLLRSVEILRGPASALYGSDGVAGAVTFTTRDPEDFLNGRDFGGRARLAYASADDSWAESLILAGRRGALSGLFAYTRRDGGEQENQGTVGGQGPLRTEANPQDNASDSILAKLVYELDGGHSLRLTFDHLDRSSAFNVLSGRSDPPLAATSVLDLRAVDETERDRISLEHRFEGGQGLIERARANLYWQDSTIRQVTFEDRNTAADRVRDNSFENRVIGGSGEIHLAPVAALGLDHRLTLGFDLSQTRQEGLRTGTVPPAGESFPNRSFPNTDYLLGGLFIQDEISLMGGDLRLYPAVRFDTYELEPEADALYPFPVAGSSDSHVSPKLGIVYWASERFGLFANLATGFRAPSPSQVNNGFSNLAFGYVSAPNPDLEPETSETVELGLRWRDVSAAGALWSGSLVAYAGQYEDFILQEVVSGAFTPTDPAVFQFINAEAVEISGVELRADGQWTNGFGLTVSASLADGTQEIGGVEADLATVEPYKLVAGLRYDQPAGRFGGQVIVTHSGEREDEDLALACGTTCFTGTDFTILDLTAYWNLTDSVALRAGVFNLTDETYWWWSDVRGVSSTSAVLDAYSQPGRNVSFSLSVRY